MMMVRPGKPRVTWRTLAYGGGAAAVLATAWPVAADPLADQFASPPASARPRTWWHWLNGNITVAGLQADLRWMARAGLGGVQAFDASLGTPQVVAHPVPYMSPEWKAAFGQAAATARREGLELAIASSPGWSETGGPWVAPADAMKKLAWSEMEVVGGRPVSLPLPPAPHVTGRYGWAPFADITSNLEVAQARPVPTAAGPVAVFAYPVAGGPAPRPSVTDTNGRALDADRLVDAREDSVLEIPAGDAAHPATVTMRYPRPQPIRAFTLFVPDAVPPFSDPAYRPRLEVREGDGWRTIATVPLANVPTTVAFAPVRAAEFRLVFAANDAKGPPVLDPAPGAVVVDVFGGSGAPPPIRIATARLFTEARVDRFEDKAGFHAVPDYYALVTDAPDEDAVPPDRVVDLSARLRADGSLDWTPPAGRWRIVRLGWSLLGTTNHPAAPDSTGLEVDKYDAAAVRRYMTTYLASYGDAVGQGVRALLTDSIEAGDANWTPRLLERFRALRGYDPAPWLPALTGAMVGSRARSDAFLYDWRRTLADLIASEHYGTIAEVAHEHGLVLYGEALESGRPQLGDDMAMRAHADVPMAAMWAFGPNGMPRPTFVGDILGAASVAHLYGQNLVAAESFTSAFSPWAYAPADLRRVADLEFALGVNRPVVHTSPSSPMEDKLPGLSLAVFGQYFNRHETWAEMARPWVDYLSRSGLLLQQGRHVADVAYFYGEEAPLTALFTTGAIADLPKGHGFDFVNADALAGELSVRDGDIVARHGARYRLLYLGGSSRRMTLPTLRRIAALAEAGATIVGDRPEGSPSLADDPQAFAALAGQLWAGGAETRVGRGRVIAGRDLPAALARLGTARDVDGAGVSEGTLLFQHRRLDDGDLFFVNNRAKTPLAGELSFRVTGRAPEIWRADSGQIDPASYRMVNGRTVVTVPLGAEEAVFVVFRKPTTVTQRTIAPVAAVPAGSVAGPWRVAFQPGRGAPPSIGLPALAPLNAQEAPGVRYFSGVASYTTGFTAPARKAGERLWLDLGAVGDVAEVRVNGQPVATLWHAPYRADVTAAVRQGANRLEVRVADLWANRLIGDAQPGAARIAFTVAPTYRPDAPLRPAGLIGPVRLERERP